MLEVVIREKNTSAMMGSCRTRTGISRKVGMQTQVRAILIRIRTGNVNPDPEGYFGRVDNGYGSGNEKPDPY